MVEVLTQDLDVFRWIDGDDLPQYRRSRGGQGAEGHGPTSQY